MSSINASRLGSSIEKSSRHKSLTCKQGEKALRSASRFLNNFARSTNRAHFFNQFIGMRLIYSLSSGQGTTRQWCQLHGLHNGEKAGRPAFRLASICPMASLTSGSWKMLEVIGLLAARARNPS